MARRVEHGSSSEGYTVSSICGVARVSGCQISDAYCPVACAIRISAYATTRLSFYRRPDWPSRPSSLMLSSPRSKSLGAIAVERRRSRIVSSGSCTAHRSQTRPDLQSIRRSCSSILASLTCPMDLAVVVHHPPVMDGLEFMPGYCLGRTVVGHSLLNRKHRFDGEQPAWSGRELVHSNLTSVIRLKRLLREHHVAALSDQHFWMVVLLDGREEHQQTGGQVLPARDCSRYNRP